MAQRVNLSPTGLPIAVKTFLAKTAEVVVIFTLEEKIYDLLSSKSTVTNIVGTRIYVSTFPDQISYPSLLFTRTGTEPMNTLDGALLNAERVDIQIDNFTTSYKTAFELSTVVERVMHDSGTFKSKLIINQDLSQTLPDMKRLYRISQEYSCWDQ